MTTTQDAILTAAAMISEPRSRVLLSDLRAAVLADRAEFDAALLDLQAARRVVLMSLDNLMERTAEVEAGALHIAGNPRHLLYVR